MSEVISVVLYGAERYAAKAMDFENVLHPGRRGDDEYVGLFADPDLVAGAVKGFAFEVGVEGEVVEAAIG